MRKMILALAALLCSLQVGAVTIGTGPCPASSNAHCIVVTWSAPSTGPAPTAYNVYTGGNTSGNCTTVTAITCTNVGTVPGNITTITLNSNSLTTWIPGRTYFFVVTSINFSVESSGTTEFSVTVPVGAVATQPATPNAPGTGSATAN